MWFVGIAVLYLHGVHLFVFKCVETLITPVWGLIKASPFHLFLRDAWGGLTVPYQLQFVKVSDTRGFWKSFSLLSNQKCNTPFAFVLLSMAYSTCIFRSI